MWNNVALAADVGDGAGVLEAGLGQLALAAVVGHGPVEAGCITGVGEAHEQEAPGRAVHGAAAALEQPLELQGVEHELERLAGGAVAGQPGQEA